MSVTTLLTFEEFEQLPDKPGKRELLRGELIELPPAKRPHSRISKLFFKALDNAVEKLQPDRSELPLGEAYFETGYQLSRSSWLQFAHGAREVWVVYPETKSVWVYREGSATRYETTLTTDLLPTFSLDLRTLFESA